MGHLEDPTLTSDLTVARDFDLGMTGPPLSISMDFTAGGLVEMVAGIACAVLLAAYAWWAPILLGGAWLSTQWLLRESAIWRDRNTEEVRGAQRRRRLRVRCRRCGAGQGAAPVRPRRLDHRSLRQAAHASARAAVRSDAAAREADGLVPAAVLGANVIVFWSLAASVAAGQLSLGAVVAFAQAAVGTSMIAFGGLSWVLDGSAAPVCAVLRLEPAMRPTGALASGTSAAAGMPSRDVRFRDLTFAYRAARQCSSTSISPSPPDRRWRSSARTAPGRRRSPSCCAG